MDTLKETKNALTDASLAYIKATPLAKRKALGQYPTPRAIYELATQQLQLQGGERVVDPAVGTGELLLAVLEKQKDLQLVGFDIDPDILEVSRQQLAFAPNVELFCMDALLDTSYDGQFDAAIANPPYFEFVPSPEIRSKYKDVISGRVNIYSLFIKKVLDLLRPGGRAVFIVPPSMNNGAYFKALRSYILKVADLESLNIISDSSHFEEAQVSVQIMTIRKLKEGEVGKANPAYVLDLGRVSGGPSNVIFTTDPGAIQARWRGRSSIYDLGYTVATGTVVWNQHKDSLHGIRESDELIVYYAKDISQGKLVLSDTLNKRRYLAIGKAPELAYPAILVNRIVGALGRGDLRAGIVRDRYYSENHVNVIIADTTREQKIALEELCTILCEDTEIVSYIREFSTNTQLSRKELHYFLPINIGYVNKDNS
jgi:adenine-specific DNA-methyltransferase